MHQIFNTTNYTRPLQLKREKVALGNMQPRYNSHVQGIREKFYINSSRNSQDTPQWMNRTRSHYFKSKERNRSIEVNDGSHFMGVSRSYCYANQPKVENRSGPFEIVQKKKSRSHWEMKNHTFQLQWPKPQESLPKRNIKYKRSSFDNPQVFSNKKKVVRDFTFFLPKYSIKQTPLHRQKQTPVKIGHKATVNSIYIK